jgi:outer membrane receptor protein involved in Fe transport
VKKQIIWILALLFFAPMALAQEEEKEQEIRPENFFDVITEGTATTFTRTERAIRTAPQAVTVITREQIEQSGATSLSEVLRFVTGINSRLTPMGSQVGIRSFGSTPFSERVLFLIDGTPYNSPDKGGYPGHPAYEDFFPIEAIKRIEVIKGPGSSLYGYNAFFGVINIITDNFIINGNGTNNVIAKGGSRNTGSGVVRGGGTSGDWKYTYLAKYKQQLGPLIFLKDPSETANLPNLNLPGGVPISTDGTDVKNGDGYFKTQYKDFAVSYLYHRDETGSFAWIKPRGLPQITRPDGTTIPSFQDATVCCETVPTEQTLQFLDGSYNTKFQNNDRLQVKAFYNRRNGNTCGNCHNLGRGNINVPVLEREDETNQRIFLNAQYDLIVASHKIIFGGDFQFDKTDKNIGRLAVVDKNINTQAAFVQDEISMADNKVIVTLGVRLDHNEITDNAVSPNASVVVLPTSKLVFRALYGRSFRQPTWNDLFAITAYATPDLAPNRLTVPGGLPGPQLNFYEQRGNPLVDTEQMDSFEAGVEYDFSKAFSVKVDGFYNQAKNLIEAYDFQSCDPSNPEFQDPNNPLAAACFGRPQPGFLAVTRNLTQHLDSNGFEVEFRIDPAPIFSAVLGYAYQHDDFSQIDPTFVDSFGNVSRTFEDAYSPVNKITAMIDVKPTNDLLFNLSLDYWDNYNTRFFPSEVTCAACTNTNEIGKSYTYANFNAFWTIQRFTLGLTVKNLFDEKVQTSHAFRVDGSLPGREWFGVFRVDF